jgi:[ribosomal protein S5]-alanine N-acetyltransferase
MKEQELLTDRLTLRLLQPDHADGLLPIWGDTDVIRFTYMRLVKDIASCVQNVVVMMDLSGKRDDTGPYVVLLGNTVIGMVGAVRMSRESSEHEIYYHLGRPWWGKGYATEAASAVIDQVFTMPLVHRISAEVVAENIASTRVLEKTGMKREGRLRGKFFKDGIYRDLYVYSVLRNEWQAKKAQEIITAAISSSGSSTTPPPAL